jgi:hypothetical protein
MKRPMIITRNFRSLLRNIPMKNPATAEDPKGITAPVIVLLSAIIYVSPPVQNGYTNYF